LKPEYAQNTEGGIKFLKDNITIQAGVFQRLGFDIIDRVKNDTARIVPFRPTNQNSLELRGVDINIGFRLNALNNSRFDIDYYNIFDYKFEKTELLSRYALDFLTSQLSASFESGIISKLRQNIRVRHCKRLSQTNAYTVVDAKLVWQDKQFNIYAQASNIFKANYTEQNNIPMPNRWFSMGVNVSFQKHVND
jgi:vitamin B12 transporter